MYAKTITSRQRAFAPLKSATVQHPHQGSTPSLTSSLIHTQNKWHLDTWICVWTFNSIYRPKFIIDLNNSNSVVSSFKKNSTTLAETNHNWAQFQKAPLTPYKTRYAFFHSPLDRVHKLTYSLLLTVEWSPVTHIPARIKLCWTYQLKKVTFARQLYMMASAFPALTNIQGHTTLVDSGYTIIRNQATKSHYCHHGHLRLTIHDQNSSYWWFKVC